MTLTKNDLHSIINVISTRYELSTGGDKHDFICGKCDAFALGLQDALINAGIECSLTLISRTTTSYMQSDDESENKCDDEIDYVDTNDFCHVYLNCFGEEWDIYGVSAGERYANEWFDESHQVTVFDYGDTDERELLAIRTAKNEHMDQEARCFVARVADAELQNIAARIPKMDAQRDGVFTP